MNEERELLRRISSHSRSVIPAQFIYKIQELLTQPELNLKREPMTDREISHGFRADKDATNAESYWAGVALAEKHYGVEINEAL